MNSIAYRPSTGAFEKLHPSASTTRDSRAGCFIPATDLPELVKVVLKEEGRMLEIQFQYISEEKAKQQAVLGNGASVTLGERTGRIYAILLPLPEGTTIREIEAFVREIANLLKGYVQTSTPESELQSLRQRAAASALSDFKTYAARLEP